MRIKYREKKYLCGDFLEVDIYPIYPIVQGKRSKRAKISSETKVALNNHNRVKKLTRLLNTNFTEDDIKIELTYSDKNLPADDDAAQKSLNNFFRRLKRFRKNAGLPDLKYVVATEKGKKTGRYHHHCVLSGGMMLKDICKIWGQGTVYETQIVFAENGLERLANYLTKNITNGDLEDNKKAWHASRNLVYPPERKNDNKISRKKAREIHDNPESNREMIEKLYPGYYLTECKPFHNEVNEQYYLCINLRKINDKPKKKNSTRVDKIRKKE